MGCLFYPRNADISRDKDFSSLPSAQAYRRGAVGTLLDFGLLMAGS
jgi:hypothetical protein